MPPKPARAPSQRWLRPTLPASWITQSSLVLPASLSLLARLPRRRSLSSWPTWARAPNDALLSAAGVDGDDRDAGLDRVLDRGLQRVRVRHRDHDAADLLRHGVVDQLGLGAGVAVGVVVDADAELLARVLGADLHHAPERVARGAVRDDGDLEVAGGPARCCSACAGCCSARGRCRRRAERAPARARPARRARARLHRSPVASGVILLRCARLRAVSCSGVSSGLSVA